MQKAEKTEYGQFMCFEFLTMVPFDLDAVVPEQMTAHERETSLMITMHRYMRKISPYLDEDERKNG